MSKYCNCKNPAIVYDLCGFKCNRCGKTVKLSVRRTWRMNPVTQIKKSDKHYKRSRDKKIKEEDL